jgi:hypothetical protein
MCSCDEGEPAKVYAQQFRRARLGYGCCECPRRIKHGQWYSEVRGCWDGSWDRFQLCMRCVARREAWLGVEGCAPPFENLTDSILECLLEEPDLKRPYLIALRAHRARLATLVAAMESTRRERYRAAGARREERKRQLAHLGGGI